MSIETKDLNDFPSGSPAVSDVLVCGRGRKLSLEDIFDLFAARLDSTASDVASADALKAEGYALGSQNGTDVSQGTYYQKNAKYYAQQAAGYASAFSAILSGQTVLSSLRLGVSGDTRQVLLSATIENGVPSLSLNIASDVLINIPSVLKFVAGNQTVSVSATIENGTPNLTYDITT